MAREALVIAGNAKLAWGRLVALPVALEMLGWLLLFGHNLPSGMGELGGTLGNEILRFRHIEAIYKFPERYVPRFNEGQADKPDRACCPTLASVASCMKMSWTKVLQDILRLKFTEVNEGQANDPDGAKDSALVSKFSREKLGWMRLLQEILRLTRSVSATDPRDKIYALFGLLKRNLPAGLSIPFLPNYSPNSTPASLFTSVASVLINEVPRLETLTHVEDHSRTNIQGLPSWVPDYSCNLVSNSLDQLQENSPIKFECALTRSLELSPFTFNCDPDPVGEDTQICSISGGKLTVTGAKFDTVVDSHLPISDSLSPQILGCLEMCQSISSEYFPIHSDPGEVL
ncbi:hypothetical protein PG988_007213 [Apiospora saccharicola]